MIDDLQASSCSTLRFLPHIMLPIFWYIIYTYALLCGFIKCIFRSRSVLELGFSCSWSNLETINFPCGCCWFLRLSQGRFLFPILITGGSEVSEFNSLFAIIPCSCPPSLTWLTGTCKKMQVLSPVRLGSINLEGRHFSQGLEKRVELISQLQGCKKCCNYVMKSGEQYEAC